MQYLRLYLSFIKFSLMQSMQFRVDFWFRIMMDVVYATVIILFFGVLFEHTDSLGGWSREQIYIFVGIWMLIDSLQMILFSNNFDDFPRLVNKGDLDFLLVRPVSSLFMVACRTVAVNSIINLCISIGFFSWAISNSAQSYSTLSYVLLPVFIMSGLLLHTLLHLLFVLPVFWTHSVDGLIHIYYSTSHITERPDGIFTGWFRRVMVSVLPFCVIASFPARFLFEDANPWVALHFFAVTVGLLAVNLFIWKRGLRAYSSASS